MLKAGHINNTINCGYPHKSRKRQNINKIEEYMHQCDYEVTQNSISELPWDYKKHYSQVTQKPFNVLVCTESVLTIGKSVFSKKDDKSAGVSRQYNKKSEKFANCQVSLFEALTDGEYVILIDTSLYLSL